MSDFSQLLTDTGEASLMLVHGDAARFAYAAAGGSPVTYAARIGPEEAVRSVESPGMVVAYRRSISVAAALLASPGVSGTATVDSIDYAITAIERTSGGDWQLELVRQVAEEVTRPDYRRTR